MKASILQKLDSTAERIEEIAALLSDPDIISDQNVKSIEYSAYEDMANKKVNEIREDAFKKFDLTCLHTYHSLGNIKVGEISFFVFVSSVRRSEVYEATQYLVDRIKNEVPIFGKEIFENEKFQWKENIN